MDDSRCNCFDYFGDLDREISIMKEQIKPLKGVLPAVYYRDLRRVPCPKCGHKMFRLKNSLRLSCIKCKKAFDVFVFAFRMDESKRDF